MQAENDRAGQARCISGAQRSALLLAGCCFILLLAWLILGLGWTVPSIASS